MVIVYTAGGLRGINCVVVLLFHFEGLLIVLNVGHASVPDHRVILSHRLLKLHLTLLLHLHVLVGVILHDLLRLLYLGHIPLIKVIVVKVPLFAHLNLQIVLCCLLVMLCLVLPLSIDVVLSSSILDQVP